MALRACWQKSAEETLCTSLSLAKALHFAITHKAEVVNVSLSGPQDRLLGQLIELALSRGITVVAAADRGIAGRRLPGVSRWRLGSHRRRLRPGRTVLLAPGQDTPTTAPGGGWQMVSGGLLCRRARCRPRSTAARTRRRAAAVPIHQGVWYNLLPATSIPARHSCAWSVRASVHAPARFLALPRHRPPPQDSNNHDVLPLQTVLRLAGIAALVLSSGAARAQAGGSIVVESDYRFRGVSLSGEDPTVHLTLSYDHPSGWYTGASLAGVELDRGSRRPAVTAYFGFARRNGARGTWEAGAILNRFVGATTYDYGEVFAGFIAERGPRGSTSRRTTSAGRAHDVRGIQRRGAAHARAADLRAPGCPRTSGGRRGPGIGQTRYDARIGLGLRIADVDVRLAWVGTSQRGLMRLCTNNGAVRWS